MNVDKVQFINLGLPSGKLWATENVKDENGDVDKVETVLKQINPLQL